LRLAAPPETLLGAAVCVEGVRAGVVGDVIFNAELDCVLGYEVLSGDTLHFLPSAAVRANGNESVEISSTSLLGEVELEYYRANGVSLRALRRARGSS